MAFFQVAALDFDGTLTSGDQLSAEAVEAIDRVRRNGLLVVLVTGRIGAEFAHDHPDIGEHDLRRPGARERRRRGDQRTNSAPRGSRRHRARRCAHRKGGAFPAGRGAGPVDGKHASVVPEFIAEWGLDCQIMHNRAELMVLPAGVTKGTGLAAVLAEMDLSPRNAIAIGDAENDLSMFDVAEAGVAVANAVPSVRHHADLVLDKPNGAGLAEFLAGPYVTGARRWCPPRSWIDIGICDDGTPAQVPGCQARIVVTGGSGSGKSYLVGLLAERWIAAGYCVLVIDPEGDHAALHDLNQVQVVDVEALFPSRRKSWSRCFIRSRAWSSTFRAPRIRKDELPAPITTRRRNVARTAGISPLGDQRRGSPSRRRRGSALATTRWLPFVVLRAELTARQRDRHQRCRAGSRRRR